MKTYFQFFEDIKSRRHELHQRRLDQMSAQKDSQHKYHETMNRRFRNQFKDRELKKTIQKEIDKRLNN